MTPDLVVDIGNTRMKWGVCRDGRVAEVRRLPLDEPGLWDAERTTLPPPRRTAEYLWAVASVNPPALARFRDWAAAHARLMVFEDPAGLPIRVEVDDPRTVGIDRLLGAVAARALATEGAAVVTVDVGTAVTVNLVDPRGVFRGGAILPGPRLMGRALHDFTARLPLVDLQAPPDDPRPATTTEGAIRIGIDAALRGGVDRLVHEFAGRFPAPTELFVTGGGCRLLAGYSPGGVRHTWVVPTLTLEGIRISAEASA